MYSEISSAVLDGLYGKKIKVETYIGRGIPGIKIIGLANTTVTEARERIRAAAKISDIELPNKKIIVNLSPANIRKEGSHLDLPILCGIYLANKNCKQKEVNRVGFLGEIGLNGEIKASKGILSMVLELKKSKMEYLVIPCKEYTNLKIIKGIDLVPVSHVTEVIDLIEKDFDISMIKSLQRQYFTNEKDFSSTDDVALMKLNLAPNDQVKDYDQVMGQNDVKRIMQIAAAGGHNVILLGEPGIGKTMCASRIDSIMPDLSEDEKLECMLIKSSAGLKNVYDSRPPIRSPYKNVTESSMFGGGQKGRIGEVTMAHNGVIILDEILEFNKKIIDGFRQPLEEKYIRISRLGGSYEYPCNFILIGTSNPCPCGYYGSSKRCSCTDLELKRYIKKLSGPILDRIDISYLMNRHGQENKATSSSQIKVGVKLAREKQFKRYRNSNILNSNIDAKEIEGLLEISEEALYMLKKYVDKFNISSRGYNKILRVSRTIADIENSKEIEVSHLSESLNYRFFDEMISLI